MARSLPVATLLVLLARSAFADSPQTGTIDGTIVDALGTALPGGRVTLGSERGDRDAITDEAGRFRFGVLPPGEYTLRAALEGFAPAEKSVRLETGQRQTVELQIGHGTAETIAVVAEVPLVDKYQTSVATTVGASVARELVFTNRNYQAVITSLPGVVHSDQSAQLAELMPSVNGSLWQENAAFIDGVDTTNSRYGGGSRILLPTSALSEVRSDAAGYGAEYGRVVGGITGVVTKSGTNEYHGDFLYIAQSQKWQAQSDAVPLDREEDLISSYEASLGGWIARDRAWFFAAAADNSTNQISSLAGGETIDNSVTSQSYIGKINFNPTQRHAFVLTAIDAPATVPFFAPIFAERAAVSEHDLGGSFETASWSWAAAANKFLEVRAAHQTSTEDRTPIAISTMVPGARPDDPFGNTGAYWDSFNGFRWRASGLPAGPGLLEYPRDQGNVALTWFLESNELKLGVDYQDVGWKALNQPPTRYTGRIYDPSLPGGFVTPLVKRVFHPISAPVETTSTNLAVFATDRIEVNHHLTLNLGLRFEDQAHDDDRGVEVLSSRDVTPRVAAVYDVAGNGKLLLKGTAGRYLTHAAQEFVNAELAWYANGGNAFDELLWNPGTLRYDRFSRTELPTSLTRVIDVEPYFKDEITGGIEWQMTRAWAFDARLIWWRVDEPFTATDQFDAQGQVFRLLTNLEEAEREYQALQLEVNRAFRSGWVVRTNYTLSKVEGNSFGQEHFAHTVDDLLEGMAVLDPASGIPVTAVNRHGRLDNDRKHIANVSGAKSFELGGEHRLTLGGWFTFRSGRRWGLRPAVTLTLPGTTATITSTRYAQPRDANQLEDHYTLSLTGGWEFPIVSRVSGNLKIEVANVTDEQEQIAVNLANGAAIPVRQTYQKPREMRLLAGVRF